MDRKPIGTCEEWQQAVCALRLDKTCSAKRFVEVLEMCVQAGKKEAVAQDREERGDLAAMLERLAEKGRAPNIFYNPYDNKTPWWLNLHDADGIANEERHFKNLAAVQAALKKCKQVNQ
jgi:hypothetical protein